MEELKWRLAELVSPVVYEILRKNANNPHLFGKSWEDWGEDDRQEFIKEEYDVTGPIVDQLEALLEEQSVAGNQLRSLLKS